MRTDDAVIVLELVGELQRATRLALGLLGERDGRGLVGDGSELPSQVADSGPAHGGRARLLDHKTAFFRSVCVAALCASGRFGDAAARRNVEVNSARTDHKDASRRHRQRSGGLRRLAWSQAWQNN